MLLLLAVGCNREHFMLTWKPLPAIPDREGFAGLFAGASNGALIVAGGANFPGQRPWEGGRKAWYDSVFVLPSAESNWRRTTPLPRATAYGVSVSSREGIICMGGGDEHQHFDDVLLLRWEDGRLTTTSLPKLPGPCAFMCGALVADNLYLAGGLAAPADTHCLRTFWSLDLSRREQGWRSLEPCPGPERMLAVAGSAAGSFFLFSGTRLSPGADGQPVREYLRDAWRYTPGHGWLQLADLPRAAVAAPSPAPRAGDDRLLIISGDDGTRVGFKPAAQHPGLPRSILAYHMGANRWTICGQGPLSRATVPVAEWAGGFVIPSGEVRPGYRTPEVWSLALRPER